MEVDTWKKLTHGRGQKVCMCIVLYHHRPVFVIIFDSNSRKMSYYSELYTSNTLELVGSTLLLKLDVGGNLKSFTDVHQR